MKIIKKYRGVLGATIIAMILATGCQKTETPKKIESPKTEVSEAETTVLDGQDKEKEQAEEKKEEIELVEKLNYQEVKPYEVGNIMIIMYHGIVENPPSAYQRTPQDLKKDLQYLYDHGYRLMSMKDLVRNNVQVEAGYKPVVLTFDDGLPSSFSLVQKDGELVPAENTGVDILNRFCKEHPDFGKTATFYINGNNDPFKGEGTLKERLQYLIDNGYEVGNHTYSHPHLYDLNAQEVKDELGKVDKMIKAELDNYEPISMAYPFGQRPVKDLRHLVEQGDYEGEEYKYLSAVRVGPNSDVRVAPNHPTYDAMNLPRVRASEGEVGDLWFYLNKYEENSDILYVSDGNPDRIAVPKKYEKNVDKDSLEDKELYIYELKE